MAFKQKKIRHIEVDEMNQILSSSMNKTIVYGPYERNKRNDHIEGFVYIEDKTVQFKVTTKYKSEIATYVTYKDARDYIDGINGLDAYKTLNQYWTVPHLKVEGISASPILDYNPFYENTLIEGAYGYDLNSAYSAAMLKGWIDASVPPEAKRIDEETEIGFDFNDDGKLEIRRRGFAFYVFKKMETPEGIKKFVNKYYDIKRKASASGNEKEKVKAKQMLNFCIGYLQKVNPWLRAWVVCSCNELIEELLDENSLFWNTDSIVSRVRRLDLEENLGADIGQWKIEHTGSVAYRGNCYQWNLETPTYRGIAKSWFREGWNILTDEIPHSGNIYSFNEESFQLEEIVYEKD